VRERPVFRAGGQPDEFGGQPHIRLGSATEHNGRYHSLKEAAL
jgi:hypothetical protein